MASLFTGAQHAQHYRQYRPTYPPEVYKAMTNYCKENTNNSFKLAVDIGCGTGQSTFPLSPYFRQVIGVDPSESQIKEARKARDETFGKRGDQEPDQSGNVDFKLGTAENLSEFESNSVDLITCAQAFHWMDLTKFYPEANRVLCKGGVLVAYGYGNVTLDKSEGSDLVWKFYKESVGPFWDNRRRHIDNCLKEFILPFADFQRIDDITIVRHMPISAFIGYLSSWSAYQTYIKQVPDSSILQQLQEKLCQVYGVSKPDESQVTAKWPVYMLLGRKPDPS